MRTSDPNPGPLALGPCLQGAVLALLGLAAVLPCAVRAADWPGWRGPDRTGVSRETAWSHDWGEGGPAVRWRAALGKGFSSFAVVAGRVYTAGNSNRTDLVHCFDAATGRVLWTHSRPCDPQPLSYEGGPSATPLVAGGRVFTFGKDGGLFCLEALSGRVIWSRSFPLWPRLEGDWANTWRYAGSPWLSGNRLFLALGQAGACLDSRDGSVLWQSTNGHPGYSSPVPFSAGDTPGVAFFAGHALTGVEAATGRPLWRLPWNTLWDLNAADPVFQSNRVFVASGNGVGCALYDLAANPPRLVWKNKNLKPLMNSAVFCQGSLYGFNDTHLSCLDWETGREEWASRDLRKGSLLLAGDRLLALDETGLLAAIKPDRRAFTPLAKARVLPGRCWTTPVLADGLLYARNAAGDMVCLDLRPAAPSPRPLPRAGARVSSPAAP